MVKFAENTHVFNHAWEDLTAASWRKYATPHPNAQHIKSVDIIDRSVDPTTGVLRSTRVIACQNQVPSWVSRILGHSEDQTYVHEVSEIDPKTKTMRLRSRNITFGSLLTVEETCTYKPHPEDPSKTVFTQECAVTAVGLNSLISGKAEGTMLGVFQSTAGKGKETLDDVCRLLVGEKEKAAFALM